jgi:2-iminobutanoate/2-iminopropanoate deaminase
VKQVIQSDAAPAPIGPYSQAVAVPAGRLVFLSGQLGLDPETGKLVSEGVGEQAAQAMRNVGAVLAAAGLGFEQVVKTTIYLLDMADFAKVNAVYGAHFIGRGGPPARSTVAVAGLPLGARVEIECLAVG